MAMSARRSRSGTRRPRPAPRRCRRRRRPGSLARRSSNGRVIAREQSLRRPARLCAASSSASASAMANSSPLSRAIAASASVPIQRSPGDRAQQLIADFIAVAVVDRLEAVDLDRKDDQLVRRSPPLGRRAALPRSAKPLRLSRPVWASVAASNAARCLAIGAQLGFLLQVGVAPPAEQDQRDIQRQGGAGDLCPDRSSAPARKRSGEERCCRSRSAT